MAVSQRKGFTLVELLVVIVIISMLVALLVPAVVAAREAARRAKCLNNQSELSKAVLQYEMAKQHYPGYVNRFGASTNQMSWVVVALPYLGREDLWRLWREGTPTQSRIAQFICPSDAPDQAYPLSYVANCGRNPAGTPPAATGVFFDHFTAGTPTYVTNSNIPDGTQSTLMMSENVQANQWCLATVNIYDVGMVWANSVGANGMINGGLASLGSTTTDPNQARPSSYHPGGVVVTFCDGHQYFLSENVDYTVYQHLMTPNSVQAGLTGTLGDGSY
jgi:prepilin-type N-terminal cleavage/methylation domain-containing protein/prepilin-type processing-associated H-X9-DG protein